jgi:hypothetical protein
MLPYLMITLDTALTPSKVIKLRQSQEGHNINIANGRIPEETVREISSKESQRIFVFFLLFLHFLLGFLFTPSQKIENKVC